MTRLTAKQTSLQNSLGETIQQYESIHLKEIKDFLDIEKEVAAKIDPKELEAFDGEENAFFILHDFLSRADGCLNTAEYNFFVDSLSKGNEDWL